MSRVIVVDDHPLVRRGMLQVLAVERPDLAVSEAGSADEVLAQLETAPADLVILDLNLPGRGGLALLSELRARFPSTPALVVSALPEHEYGLRSLELGASGFLAKESAAEALALAVGKVLEGGRYVSPAMSALLADRVGQPGRAPPEVLSERERQVLRLVASGRTLREIAVTLGVSEKTVASYRARLGLKLGLSTSVELTRYALSHGLAD